MRKLLLTLAVITASLSTSAASIAKRSAVQAAKPSKEVIAIKPSSDFRTRHHAVPLTRATSDVKDLEGKYIITMLSGLRDVYPACYNVNVSPLGSDSIIISGISYYRNIHAKVDLATGKISIPSQIAYLSTTLGKESIAKFDWDNVAPIRNEDITGTIYTDGSISIDDYWGLFVDSGQYADYYFDIWTYADFMRPNGTLKFSNSYIESPDTTTDVAIVEYGDSLIGVSNFADNYGAGGFYVQMLVNKDSTVTIPKQYLLDGGDDYGTYYINAYGDNGESADSLVLGNGKTSNKSITFEPFTIMTNQNYWYGRFSNNVLSYTNNQVFIYPNDESTGINSIETTDKHAESTEYYNVLGSRVNTLQKGLNIVVTRYKDGTVKARKVLRK